MNLPAHVAAFQGTAYRFLAVGADPLGPAGHPVGRSHHSGQPALYLSETPEGCRVATRRYLGPGDPPRVIVPLSVTARVIDLRDAEATAAFDIDVTNRAAEWQPIVEAGHRSPTWDISDAVRAAGFDGMLYASRTRPDLAHLTLFAWNVPGGATVRRSGPDLPVSENVQP